MNMEKTYTYKELIDTYIKIPQLDYVHADFRNYYSGLVSALEQLFDVRIDIGRDKNQFHPPEPPGPVMFFPLVVLFEESVDRLRRGGVGERFLEGGPWFSLHKLKQEDPAKDSAFREYLEVKEREKDLRSHYRSLLHELFAIFYGKTDLSFTSED